MSVIESKSRARYRMSGVSPSSKQVNPMTIQRCKNYQLLSAVLGSTNKARTLRPQAPKLHQEYKERSLSKAEPLANTELPDVQSHNHQNA